MTARIAASSRRSIWIDDIDQKSRDEILSLREDYRRGDWGAAKALTVARAIRATFVERGVHLCDVKRLAEWLKSEV